jgi:hypothetical protein
MKKQVWSKKTKVIMTCLDAFVAIGTGSITIDICKCIDDPNDAPIEKPSPLLHETHFFGGSM